MRLITKQIATAFKAGQTKSIDNTRTDGQAVYLHGSKIAEKQGGKLYVTLAGWPTNTTRERVNGILREFGFSGGFNQKNFTPYFNGREVGSREWIVAE